MLLPREPRTRSPARLYVYQETSNPDLLAHKLIGFLGHQHSSDGLAGASTQRVRAPAATLRALAQEKRD